MEDLRERVEAVERALTDGNGELTALAEGAASAQRVDELSAEMASIQEEVDELSAATQALRGYLGNVRSVNESVEERADAAVAAVDSLEERVDDIESRSGEHTRSPEHVGHSSTPEALTSRKRSQHARIERSDTTTERSTCAACGRPADGTAAPDGGSHDGLQDGPRTGHSPSTTEPQKTGSPSSTRESVAGFDPNGGGGRVRIREEAADPVRGDGGQERDTEADRDPSLVDRMRELL